MLVKVFQSRALSQAQILGLDGPSYTVYADGSLVGHLNPFPPVKVQSSIQFHTKKSRVRPLNPFQISVLMREFSIPSQ